VIALVENNPRALQSNSAAVLRRFSDGNVPLNGQRTTRIAKARPTIDELREYLDYEPETGVLRWKKACGRVKAGAIAGSVWRRGDYTAYLKLKFKGRSLQGHRVAFALHHGRWPDPCCDHIDGNGLNNRVDNLRQCSVAGNAQNKRFLRPNATGVKGVYAVGAGYQAQVKLNRHSHTKYFGHLEDAAAWVKQTREQLHGEFARH
jgi:hypothetical protein